MGPPNSNHIAFVFPGQASQRAGMAAALLEQEPAARPVFAKAAEVLELDLAGSCSDGSEEQLTHTEIAQPALLTTSLAWLAVLRERGVAARLLAGHSLGEFGAWVASGALDFENALTLVRRRGRLMAEAGQRNPGSMLAIVGLPDDEVLGICRQASRAGVLAAANFNSPGQVVVSGQMPALEEARELAKSAGGRAIPLKVSGAFHSPLMSEAAGAFAELLVSLPIGDPQIPVVANATADVVSDAQAARRAMAEQMTSPVLWTTSVQRMIADGIRLFVEVGPGHVLSNLIARISADVRARPVGTPAELQTLLEEVLP